MKSWLDRDAGHSDNINSFSGRMNIVSPLSEHLCILPMHDVRNWLTFGSHPSVI